MSEKIELSVAAEVDTKELEEKMMASPKVSEATVEKSLNYDLLTDNEKAAIDDFIQKVDISDTTQLLQYGSSAQSKISKFSDNVLQNVKTKSTGEVGNLLTDLVVQIKDFDTDVPDSLEAKGIFGIFHNVKKQVEKLIAKYDKVENNISKIEKQLESHKLQMLKDIAVFDTMYEKNLEYFKELSLYIIAGNKKLEQLKNEVLPALHQKAEETGEQNDAQAYNDMINIVNRFEKKLYDLKTTRIISIQMAPQIRLIQNNDTELVDKIQSSLINTIPLWKNQMIIALGLANANKALEAQKKVTDLTNDMLVKNSELLKQGTVKIAKESERGIVDLETVKKTNQDLMDTIDSLIKIHEEGSQKRAEAEGELNKIEGELKAKLLELKA